MAVALTIPGLEVPPYSCRLDDNVWGLDISTRRIALAIVQGRGAELRPEVGWFSLEVEQHGGGARRLAWLLEALPPWVRRYADVAPPAAVLAEQPYGQGKSRPHPQSYYVVGIVLAVLATEFPNAPVENVTPGEWKAEALGLGKGAARKPTILRWANDAVAYTGECPKCNAAGDAKCDNACRAHDEADALGVATSAAIRWAHDRSLR